MKESKLLGVYCNLDTDTFNVGKLIAYDEKYLLLDSVGEDGKAEGLLVYKNEYIAKVETDTEYLSKLEKLIEDDTEYTVAPNADLFEWVIRYSVENHKMIDCEIDNSGYCNASGYILSSEGGVCVIEQIEQGGRRDGKVYIPMNRITSLNCDTAEHRRIERLKKL